mmetsp:Transcript_1858/g.3950  ORF Transcript_1858/g.3950 Transcript_1858/m.3950 type:complete len:487 (+) Transcript_1858:109-1569(+)
MAALAAEDTDPGSPTSLLADHRTESPQGGSPRARPVQPPPLPSGTLAALDQIPDVEADTLSGMVALAEGASAFILEARHTPADQSGSKPEPQRVAVKLARTKEGMIKADVEAEVRLLYTLSRLEGADEAAAAAAAERGDGNESGSGSEAAAGTNDGRAYVVKFLGSGFHHDGRRFLILELCASTLEQLLNVAVLPNNGGWMQKMRGGDRRQDNSIGGRSGGPPVVSLSRALKIGFELTLALQWLHTAAIPGCCVVHRDIKPSNIGLTSTGSVRLLDLGLARVVPRTTLDHSADEFAAADGGEEGGEKLKEVSMYFLNNQRKVQWKSRPRRSTPEIQLAMFQSRAQSWYNRHPQCADDVALHAAWTSIEPIAKRLFDRKTILFGGNITRIELMKALQTDRDLATVLQIPQVLNWKAGDQQSMDVRGTFERVFELMDSEGNQSISVENFLEYTTDPHRSGIETGTDCMCQSVYVVRTRWEWRFWPPCC